MERGSEEGKISWTPWQEEQFATVLSPRRAERPWKALLVAAHLFRCEPVPRGQLSAAWQAGHVFPETAPKETWEVGSAAWRMSCSPWQSAQLGASGTPRTSDVPCTLSR